MLQKIAKFISNLFINCILLIILIVLFAAIVTGISYANMSKRINEGKEYYKTNYTSAKNCFVDSVLLKNHANSSNETPIHINTYSSLVKDCLERYPENVRACITDNWSIVFTPTTPAFATQYLDGCSSDLNSAVTVPDIQTIFVYTKDIEVIPYVLTHEFGHALAYEYGCLEYTKDFEELYYLFKHTYKETSPYAVPSYAVRSSSEFFASTLSAYVTEPEWLWLEAPGVADYMEEMLKTKPYKNEFGKIITRVRGMIRVD